MKSSKSKQSPRLTKLKLSDYATINSLDIHVCKKHRRYEYTATQNFSYCPICYNWLDEKCGCEECVNRDNNALQLVVYERLLGYGKHENTN